MAWENIRNELSVWFSQLEVIFSNDDESSGNIIWMVSFTIGRNKHLWTVRGSAQGFNCETRQLFTSLLLVRLNTHTHTQKVTIFLCLLFSDLGVLCKADSAAKEVALLHVQCYKANQPGQVRSMVPVTDHWGLLQTCGVQIHQGKNHYHSTKASTFNIIIQHYHSTKAKLSRQSFAYPDKRNVQCWPFFCELLFTKLDN